MHSPCVSVWCCGLCVASSIRCLRLSIMVVAPSRFSVMSFCPLRLFVCLVCLSDVRRMCLSTVCIHPLCGVPLGCAHLSVVCVHFHVSVCHLFCSYPFVPFLLRNKILSPWSHRFICLFPKSNKNKFLRFLHPHSQCVGCALHDAC